jgi:putative membrane protein
MLMTALRELGLAPIAAICAYRIVTIALNARSWQLLLPPDTRPFFPTLLRLRWIGEAVNSMLPVAQIGGDVARASLVTSRGVPRAEATASMVADLWTAVITQVVFGLAGALVVGQLRLHGTAPLGPSKQVFMKLALATIPLIAILALRRLNMGRVAARLTDASGRPGRFARLSGGLARLDSAMTALLARERAVAASLGWHLVAWVSQVGETWIVLALVGAPVSLPAALAIESMATAARGAAFFVPGGLGVQEVTIISMSRLLGVDMEAAIALGIAKRARELLVGLPGLLAWVIEKKRAQGKAGGL